LEEVLREPAEPSPPAHSNVAPIEAPKERATKRA